MGWERVGSPLACPQKLGGSASFQAPNSGGEHGVEGCHLGRRGPGWGALLRAGYGKLQLKS